MISNEKAVIETEYGYFIGKRQGECIKISFPANTNNEWGQKTEFLDLPYMNKKTFQNFVESLGKFSKLFK